MKFSTNPVTKSQAQFNVSQTTKDSDVPLVREAGTPFQMPLNKIDPFAEWLSLMEVVQMLCPSWPVRNRPMLGKEWKL